MMNTNIPVEEQNDLSPETKRGINRWILRGLFAKLAMAALLFIPANRLDWGMGWAYVGIFLAFDLATLVVSLRTHPGLLAERADLQEGTKPWDRVIVRLAAGYLPMACWVIAGLDDRFGWSEGISGQGQIVGLAGVILGYALIAWAMAANAFFSVTVRIQTERGHTVAAGGPYRIVRHPGYVGAMLFNAFTPVMLGSWWAMIPAGLVVVAYTIRTALEDKTLHDELDGYREYAQKTHYRLLPGIW
jgi:protein-S-isoprenylcysteine O-methyltransferase Ste14